MLLREAGRRHRRLSDVCDEYLTPVIIVFLVMASLRSMPDVVANVSGLMGSVFSFFIGIAAGIFVTLSILVVAVFLLTKRIAVDEAIPLPSAKKRERKRTQTHPQNTHVQHPNIMRKGRFASCVWIVSGSEWPVTKPIHKFPPPDFGTGDSKGLVKYYAEVKDGVLTFSWVDALQKKQVMIMELEGCRCRLVEECLGTKNVWWRKAPIEISHPNRCLYQGSNSVLMFCMHGADKEQWFVSLSRHMADGDSIKVIQHIYKRYSKRCRNKTELQFPGYPSINTRSIKIDEKVHQSEKSTWFTSWRRGSRSGSFAGELEKSAQCGTVELAEEIEQLWSGGKSHSVFTEELNKRRLRSQNKKTKTIKRSGPGAQPSSAVKPQTKDPPKTTSLAPKTTDQSTSKPEEHEAPAVKTSESSSATKEAAGSSSQKSAESQKPVNDHPSRPGSKGGPSADGVFGLNMFLARWTFDLFRNPDFEEKFRAAVLKKLRGIRRPDYVTPLTLCALDLGSNFPEICSIRSLPPEGTVICPELLVDVSYAGGLEMMVETFVDLREGSVWGTLDRALNTLQGNQAAARQRDDALADLNDMSDVQEDMSDFGTVAGDTEQKDQAGSASDKQTNGFSMRKYAALKAKQFAERMAESISKIPLRLSVRVVKLEGTLLVWISPPPAKRLWISFIQTPDVEITAKPILANRVMKYSAGLGRVSSWLQRKMKQSFFSNLVFPNCTDLSFPGLLGLQDESGLRHPSLTMMEDLTQVSECDSEYSDSESNPPSPSPAEYQAKQSLGSFLERVPLEITKEECQKSSEEGLEKSSSFQLPTDDRLDAIRHHRYDKHRLNTFRRTWQGQSLTDEDIPCRQSHGRKIYKRFMSLSDGDASQGDSDDLGDNVEEVMSDVVEFFDPEGFGSANLTESLTEDEATSMSCPEQPVKTETDKEQQLKGMTPSPSHQSISEKCQDAEAMCSRETPTRGIGSRIGDLFRNMQPSAEESDASRKKRSGGNFTSSNNIIQVAKQKAGEQRQRMRDAFENRTAQLKNSGLTRIWSQRRGPEGKLQTD